MLGSWSALFAEDELQDYNKGNAANAHYQQYFGGYEFRTVHKPIVFLQFDPRLYAKIIF